jgi:small subunit ribosomal protein S21
MATVTVNQGESIESALRRFKRKVMTEEIIKDAKKHAFFMSKGQKAKLKSALAAAAPEPLTRASRVRRGSATGKLSARNGRAGSFSFCVRPGSLT